MVRLLIVAGFALAFLPSLTQGGVRLTPRIAEYQLDGVKFTHLVFTGEDGREITYSPPAGWDYAGEATLLTLRPKKNSQAEANVFVLPLTEPFPFAEPAMTRLRDEALATAPDGSSDVTLLSVEKNPVFIGQKETVLVTFSYVSYGQRYGRSLMFLNRPGEQVRFQLTSRWSDFKELQQAFLQSHFTWQNL